MLPMTLWRLAYSREWEEVFRRIVANCYNVNGTFEYRMEKLLHVAAEQGNVAAGKKLLEMGADPHARQFPRLDGWTAMQMAAWCGHADFCAALPSTCIAQSTVGGYTALHFACQIVRGETNKNITERCRLICWLLAQHECDLNANADRQELPYRTWRKCVANGYIAEDNILRVEAAFEWARGGRQRWTPARAAWIVACCV